MLLSVFSVRYHDWPQRSIRGGIHKAGRNGYGFTMEDYDNLESFDPKAAKEYVLAFIVTLKQTRAQREKRQEELSIWQGRVKLAEQRGAAELKSGAEARVAELTGIVESLKTEERELTRRIDVLKTQLRSIRSGTAPSVDVDLLLAQLEMLVGEPDTLARAMEAEEADAALQELKQKLKGPSTPEEGKQE